MLVEWELTLNCNYNCAYCGRKHKKHKKKEVTDRKILEHFISNVLTKFDYKDADLFCFGGEPTLHPEFAFIVHTLRDYNIPFVIQTNLSDISTEVFMSLDIPLTLQVSFHHSQVKDIKQFINNVNRVQHKHLIRRIDIMFEGSHILKDYFILRKAINKHIYIQIAPIGNFLTYGYTQALLEFNKLKRNMKHIPFETTYINYYGKHMDKTFLWEKFHLGQETTFNKPCLYKGKYVLFDPTLQSYTCSYGTGSYDVCPFRMCFLM